ncbi:tetratricopeptide repeat protein [Rhodoferax sp. 4810]|uniref:protein O-GlcNAc transferase n=1 Tax=Thiospirillum jenense TaxID=1653858 RepID=A0A839H9U5_9GAMM|nr:tetratricopeptide repeat protein [Thiospirillum jenense]MBB1073369.1 tetratricopeptide repeat protein [Rhodoferax jenense]MBB1125721.1 tetratricopeptide repeat protein [Thiospirillum jenense]
MAAKQRIKKSPKTTAKSNKTVGSVSYELLTKGLELQQQGRNDEAAQLFNDILQQAPTNPVALYSLSVIAIQRDDVETAFKYTTLGTQTTPSFAPLWFAHGEILQRLEQREEALVCYDKALKLQPDYPEVLINSGVLLRNFHRHHAALERFNQVLQFDPNCTNALSNCAIILSEMREHEQAIKLFERLYQVDPNYHYALGLLNYERLRLCDWSDFENAVATIEQGIRAGQRVCKTLALMAFNDNAEIHFQAARTFAQYHAPRQAISYWNGEQYQHARIRIAYISPDLREHPVGHLTVGLFEQHDKTRFETIAISIGIDDNSRIRARMMAAFERFIDARTMTAKQIAQLVRELEVDIVIDLAGYTSDARVEIFGYRPAPVLVTYLGYPGTLATDYFDYLIADPWGIPPEHQQFYSEKIAYLPHCYVPFDTTITLSNPGLTRAECGLPETAFVFCVFSQNYKMNPLAFAIWMRLLKQIPDSVLWLTSNNSTAQHHLRLNAVQYGIDPARIIFAGRIPRIEDHLSRYRCADLFLDTHPCNAHTTAADALFAGLPVVTWMGGAFPSRVAGSLLHSLGLSELVAANPIEYEALALALARDPVRLAALRQRVIQARQTGQALFNTEAFCRNLETLYEQMWQRVNGADVSVGFAAIEPANTPPPTAPVQLQSRTRCLALSAASSPADLFNPFAADEVVTIPASCDLIIEPLPFPAQSFEYVVAKDVLQFIPRLLDTPARRYPFIALMNEIARVLKPGGQFLSITPAYPHPEVFSDPRAVNIISEHTFSNYFSLDHPDQAKSIGFNGDFVIENQHWQDAHLITTLRKVATDSN